MNELFAPLQKVGNFIKSTLWIPTHTKKYDPPLKILILGLDYAGGTSFLYKLNDIGGGKDPIDTAIPMIGMHYEKLNFHGDLIVAHRLGGRSPRHYSILHKKLGLHDDVDGIIFIVDSNAEYSFEEARDQLHFTIDQDEKLSDNRKSIPLLILCNKQDLLNTKTPNEIAEMLNLSGMQRTWSALGCSCATGEGVKESFEWLVATIRGQSKLGQFVNDDDTATTGSVLSSSTMDSPIVLDFDPTKNGCNLTLKHFDPIKHSTECPFAKAAVLWGGSPCAEGETIKQQAKANIAALSEFVNRISSGEHLDGFCIELVDDMATKGSVQQFGDCVRRMLGVLSNNDPAGERMMSKRYIGGCGWRFRFDKVDFFITTFAPCYASNSSRYAFETGNAFILLQPEVSFARHNITPDTVRTNWDNPKTMRDMARVRYRNAGRPYHIPKTTMYPPAEHIVKPLEDNGDSPIRWWQPL